MIRIINMIEFGDRKLVNRVENKITNLTVSNRAPFKGG
jgi:hypothetical protein